MSSPADSTPTAPDSAPSNFIRDIIDADLASSKHTGVVTRFPPEPNGYLHIGHAKSVCLNFGLARDYAGRCHLRFDDTDPTKEDVEYVDSIQADIRWLGFEWDEHLYYASDYFEKLYQLAEQLIGDGLAFVCSLDDEQMREYRGTLTEPGRPSPDRERLPAESLDLLRRMRAGEFPDGAYTVRLKIDMASPNMKMRDPAIYRIRHAHHYRQGDKWCIYPLYDYTHGLSDSFEGITHSICTLEFENNRELYDWIIEATRVPCQPKQYEFARLKLNYTVMSKRKLLQLVQAGHVSGWDDPRMPTLAGLRRRGVPPEVIRAFCDRVGVAKNNSVVDLALFEATLRDDLNPRVPRVQVVLDPLKVVIENYPEGETEALDAPYYPHDVPLEGSRALPFSRELYIERADFLESPPKRYHRLAPGREVRLRYAYFIRCERAVKDAAGRVVELRCTYDPETRGGSAPDGRKVRGTIHWVSAAQALPVEVRSYDRLFAAEQPGAERDFLEDLNPDSLVVRSGALAEPSLADAAAGDRFQFERQGYFSVDSDSTAERRVFNRIVGLRDSWTKQTTAPTQARGRDKKRKATHAERAPLSPAALRLKSQHGLSDHSAGVLADDASAAELFLGAIGAGASPTSAARWVVNELLPALRKGTVPFGGPELAELTVLVDDGTISKRLAKDVLAAMLAGEGGARAIVEARGLQAVGDEGALEPVVDQVLAAHPDEVARFRGGEQRLLGFFVGQLMRATGGKADPKLANRLLRARLSG